MFRLVLPDNLNTFGSPASTVFRSASRLTAVALTVASYHWQQHGIDTVGNIDPTAISVPFEGVNRVLL